MDHARPATVSSVGPARPVRRVRVARHRPLFAVALAIVAAGGVLARVSGQIPAPPDPAEVTPIVGATAVPAGSEVRAALAVRLDESLHANSNAPRDPTLIPMTLRFEVPDGVSVSEIVWPDAGEFEQRILDTVSVLDVFQHEFTVGVRIAVGADVPPGPTPVRGFLRYQACDDRLCYPPATVRATWTLPVVSADQPATLLNDATLADIRFGTGEAPPDGFVAPLSASPVPLVAGGSGTGGIDGVATIMASLDGFELRGATGGYLDVDDFLQFLEDAEAGVAGQSWFEGRGPVAILALVLLGGLALNLTPCVLPMIPINLAIIGAGAQAGSRTRGFLLGGTYGAAMAVAYGLLGLIVILTAGTFGTINASPWFNLGIAALFVVLGLAMFDVFTIDFSRLSSRFRVTESSRGTFLLAFTMGTIAALLAGACVAPVVIQVVLFASDLYAGGTVVALALPFFLGLGMAIPWPIAGAGIAALPKPGAWMVKVKWAFGVFILATAAYYGWTAYGIFANRWVDADAVAASVEAKLEAGWHASLVPALAEATREHKPVLVDFWATWCKNCLVMDQTTLADGRVLAALEPYVKVKFQAEDPNLSPAREVMKRVDAVGLPTYAVLYPVE